MMDKAFGGASQTQTQTQTRSKIHESMSPDSNQHSALDLQKSQVLRTMASKLKQEMAEGPKVEE